MQLRTVIGAHAGEVREYTFVAGRAALRDGMAEPVHAPEPVRTQERRPLVTAVTERTSRHRAARRE